MKKLQLKYGLDYKEVLSGKSTGEVHNISEVVATVVDRTPDDINNVMNTITKNEKEKEEKQQANEKII